MRWRGFAAGLLLGAAATMQAHAADDATLELAVARSIAAAPIYVAEHHGLFKEAGVDVRLRDCLSGLQCLAEVFAGRAQLSTVTELAAATAAQTRNDFAILASVAHSARDMKILVRRDAQIGSVAQLTGRRVAIVKGTAVHHLLDMTLLLAGIDPRAVVQVPLSVDRFRAAMADGTVDACVIWEPFAQELLRDAHARAAVLPTGSTHVYTLNLVASATALRERNDHLVRMFRALDRAIADIQRSPAEAQQLLVKRLGLPAEDIAARWPDYDFRLALPQSLVGKLEGQGRWAVREGLVPAAPGAPRAVNVLQVLEPGPLREAVPSANTLVK